MAGRKSGSCCSVVTSVEEADTESKPDDSFVYDNAFGPHTKIKYYNTSTGFKEDIILEQNVGMNRFSFEIDTHGDIPRLTEDAGMILVYDKDNSEEQKYRFGSLYAYDSFTPGTDEATGFEHLTFDCHYELEELGDSRYRITVVVSEEWLNHPETIYPVTIDPPLVGGPSNLDDTYIRESAPASNYYLESRLRIGNYNGTNYNDGRCHTFMKFKNLPSLTNVTVTSATLKLKLLSGQSTAHPIRAWRVTSSWTSSGLKWNNRPSNSEDSPIASPIGMDRYELRVDAIVNAWYNGAPNYGFLINYDNSGIKDLNSLYSSDCGISTYYPTLTFEYTTAAPIASGTYLLRNSFSGKYLDAAGGGQSQTNVIQYNLIGGLNQQWTFTYTGGGYYKISPAYNSNLALDVTDASKENDANVWLYTSNSSNAQRWKVIKNPNGTYRLASKCSQDTRVLTVANASLNSGANVIQYEYNESGNDEWILVNSKLENKNVTSDYSVKLSGNNMYMDYTKPINKMLAENFEICKKERLMTSGEFIAATAMGSMVFGPIPSLAFQAGKYLPYQASCFYWFFNQVNHGEAWDIKVPDSWIKAFPGIPMVQQFYYNGTLMAPADLGNYIYGYLGTAMRIGQDMLLWGGGVAHIKNTYYKPEGTFTGYLHACTDSRSFHYPYGDLPEDTVMIKNGVAAFNRANPNYTIALNIAPDIVSESAFNTFVDLFTDLFQTNPL